MRDYFFEFVCALPDAPKPVWTNGDEILCLTQDAADAISYLLSSLYRKDEEERVIVTGYYEPGEDERMNEKDDFTGWYYVTLD